MKKLALLLILFAGSVQAHDWPAELLGDDQITFIAPSGAWCRGMLCNSVEMARLADAKLRETYCIGPLCAPPNGATFEIHVGMYSDETYAAEYHMLYRMVKNFPQQGVDHFQKIATHKAYTLFPACDADGWSWSLGVSTDFDTDPDP